MTLGVYGKLASKFIQLDLKSLFWEIRKLCLIIQVGWILRKLMTSTTVDTEYKLNEDKSTFTKVFGSHKQIYCSIPFPTGYLKFFAIDRISNAHARRILPKEKPIRQR